MFLLYRFVRNSSHPALKWVICALLAALGVAFIAWGLLDHSAGIAVRGVLELVIVGVILPRLRSSRSPWGGGRPNQGP